VRIEHIARLIGHADGSAVTETVYRKQLRPVIDEGATVTDRGGDLFAGPPCMRHTVAPTTANARHGCLVRLLRARQRRAGRTLAMS
jgi:hypothetical protein